ncbi:MAG TPA: hypothetical protein ENI48_10240 [Thioploca sp.]|nr:hypothetical protein [Thioploca sp.]
MTTWPPKVLRHLAITNTWLLTLSNFHPKLHALESQLKLCNKSTPNVLAVPDETISDMLKKSDYRE